MTVSCVTPFVACVVRIRVRLHRALSITRAVFFCLSRPALLLALLPASIFGLNPHQPLSQLYHSSWNARQGVNGSVTALAQTTDGYLWVGTTDGLLRFDGVSFEHYHPENGSFPATSVSTLLAVPDGGLWVGFARGGASFLKNGHVSNHSYSNGFPVSTVRCFARDRAGRIWAAVVGGFVRFDGQRWIKPYSEWNFPDKTAWRLLVDRAGTLWVGTPSQIVFLPDGEKRFRTTGIQSGKISALTQSPDGAILFYDDDHRKFRAFRCTNEKKIEMLPELDIPANSAVFDRDGALWIGRDGLSRVPFPDGVRGYAPKAGVEKFTSANGLSNQYVETILEDREGNIWVGTDGGLDRFRLRNLTWFPLRGGPFTLVAGADGLVWAGSKGNAFPLVKLGNGKTEIRGPSDVFTAYRDPDGTVWLGANNGLVHWQNGTSVSIPVPERVRRLSLKATPPDPIIVSAITKDRAGNLWVAFGGTGEFRLANGVWTFVPILAKHPDWSASYALTDSSDRVWLCWADRIARYDHGTVRIFGAEEGLTIGPPIVMAERNQEIWVGGESGLTFLQGDRFHTVQTRQNVGFTSVTGIVATPNRGLWLSTASGIVHIPEAEIDAVSRNPKHKVTVQVFDLISDLPDPIQQGDVYSSGAIQADDGTLWFATRGGAVRIDPAHIYRNPFPPPVAIQSIVADESNYSLFSDPRLPALTKNLKIGYAALSLSIPERVRFRYRLEGSDIDWQDGGTRREASFTNLAPGKYSFHVVASNNDGVWNGTGAALSFTVRPAWYQSHWFLGFCAVAAFFILAAFHRFRVGQVSKAISARFDERLAERTRIARELHDTFLQTIQGSKLVADDALDTPTDPARMRRAIEQLSTWLGQATEEGRAALNSLRASATEKNDLAEAFRRALEDCRIRSSVTPSFSVVGNASEMHPIVRDEVFRIGYEAIRNACAHSRAAQVDVQLTYAGDLTLRVKDNGIGIDAAVVNRGKEGHFGLQGMRERATRILSRLRIVSSSNAGTEVELVVPGKIIYRKPPFDVRHLTTKIRSVLKRSRTTPFQTKSDR